MDTQISLALMSKAKLVFERDDTFLAFPLTPLAYDRQQLNFASDNAAQNVSRLLEFSHVVDRIPEGMIWGTSGDHALSDVYSEVLRDAALATSTRSAAEEAAYNKARKFLFVEDAEGLQHDTPVYLAYQQGRDAYIRALEDYKNAQLTAENSSDAAAKHEWTTVDEPLLRAKVDAATDAWNNAGQKAAVEQAKNVISSLGAKSASLTWSQWQSHCNPDLDFQTDPATNQTFAPAAFSPANALDQGAWQRFTLGGREVDTLAKQAPPELRSRLGGNVVDVDVDSVSFEYSSAGLMRPWFSSDVFRARFWRFDQSTVLSDGLVPAHGLCPAYIAGVVFARNLDIKLSTTSPKNDNAAKQLGSELFTVASFGTAPAARFTGVMNAGAFVKSTPVSKPAAVMTVPSATIVRPSAPAATIMHPSAATTLPSATIMRPSAAAATMRMPPRAMGMAPMVMAPVMTNRSMVVLQNNFVRAPVLTVTPGKPIPKPADADDNHITILAFICKRLPRCPDPDPALRW